MIRFYKRLIGLTGCVFLTIAAILILTDKTSESADVLQQAAVWEADEENHEEAAYATIVPNDLTVTMLGGVQEAEYEASSFTNKVVAYVDDFLPVRTEATRDSETIGKMYPGCVAELVELGEVWSKVRSGNVEGYIQNMYVCFDEEAEALAIMLGGEEELSLAVSIEEEAAMQVKAAEEAAARKAAEEAARKAAEEAAKKAAEEAARKAAEEAAKKAAEEAQRAALEAQTEATAETVTDAAAEAQTETQTEEATVSPYYMELSEEDIYLIACIIDWESGYEPYEGKLAVANVVLNRVRSGSYPDTVSGVIYQRGQFSGVLDSSGNYSSRWQTRLANGPRTQECYQAAREAASGVNNVIGYYAFNGTRYCNLSSYRSYIIIGNHCFYQR